MSGTQNSDAPVHLELPSFTQLALDYTGTNYAIDDSIVDEERNFYMKMYPSVCRINQRKVHCTVCRMHIGTSVNSESNIKMHPILRVTHCIKCHDFYNSGEFSKGEDGSELYCRWCGQGGEVYCCSTCPFVFCKTCIVKNLSRGIILDIEQNENWNCFNCTSKILWPLRAQHWALVNYIETNKKGITASKLSEQEQRHLMLKDSSTCCRLAKSKTSSLSDSIESLESNISKRSHASSTVSSATKKPKVQGGPPPAKRPKSSNDEVVCTPDLLTMLEPDCQISVPAMTSVRKILPPTPATKITTPRIVTVQQNYTGPSSLPARSASPQAIAQTRGSAPPPLVLSNTAIRYRQPLQSAIVRRTIVPNALQSAGPVFHTINGFRVDLSSAAQQDSYRLPNGRLIQVKRQIPASATPTADKPTATPGPNTSNTLIISRPRAPNSGGAIRPGMNSNAYGNNMGIYNPLQIRNSQGGGGGAGGVRLNNGSQVPASSHPSAPRVQIQINTGGSSTSSSTPTNANNSAAPPPPRAHNLVRHVFPPTAIGSGRTQLQEQIFNAMEICTHLTGKVQTLTNSNAYNQARSFLDLKELYIHLSYLMTYAIGRFKGLQDKCLTDMRDLGFINDANSLENGQLAAAVDYVCYGKLDDIDLFNTGCNSFHHQVYEYRKSLHSNLKEGESDPLPPLFPLGVRAKGDPKDVDEEEDGDGDRDGDVNENDEPDDFDYDDQEDSNVDNDEIDDLDSDDIGIVGYESTLGPNSILDTEETMNRNEQAHAYDRKLTRLLREYPSIWCTCHADYGKMEITRKQWRVIASHFQRGDNIKLRWKNIRKRYVRIERRLKQGKRFKGYFDKATNYLANRDLPEDEWVDVDCGEDDGDGFERKELDAIEHTMHSDNRKDDMTVDFSDIRQIRSSYLPPTRPMDVRPIDMRIINFAKSHPVLWRKSTDPEFNSIDEQTRKSLWLNFWKSTPKKQASDDEDNEIQIVEPKTDTITIDSDNEEDAAVRDRVPIIKAKLSPLKITSVTSTAHVAPTPPQLSSLTNDLFMDIDESHFSTSILASMLEVDINDGGGGATGGKPKPEVGSLTKKQPRKKLTNKRNPALLQLERERMEQTKRTDAKLNKKCIVKIRRLDADFEIARKYFEQLKQVDRKTSPETDQIEEERNDVATKTGNESTDRTESNNDETPSGDSQNPTQDVIDQSLDESRISADVSLTAQAETSEIEQNEGKKDDSKTEEHEVLIVESDVQKIQSPLNAISEPELIAEVENATHESLSDEIDVRGKSDPQLQIDNTNKDDITTELNTDIEDDLQQDNLQNEIAKEIDTEIDTEIVKEIDTEIAKEINTEMKSNLGQKTEEQNEIESIPISISANSEPIETPLLESTHVDETSEDVELRTELEVSKTADDIHIENATDEQAETNYNDQHL